MSGYRLSRPVSNSRRPAKCRDQPPVIPDQVAWAFTQLIGKGFEIVGISPDSVKSHKKFAKKFNLQFNLVADTEKKKIAFSKKPMKKQIR